MNTDQRTRSKGDHRIQVIYQYCCSCVGDLEYSEDFGLAHGVIERPPIFAISTVYNISVALINIVET